MVADKDVVNLSAHTALLLKRRNPDLSPSASSWLESTSFIEDFISLSGGGIMKRNLN